MADEQDPYLKWPPNSHREVANDLQTVAGIASVLVDQFATATQLAVNGKIPQARRLYDEMARQSDSPVFRAIIENDLATLAALEGDLDLAKQKYGAALEIDPSCTAARENLSMLLAETAIPEHAPNNPDTSSPLAVRQTKVAIVSILFNWPSTGGGTIHTAETGKFLGLAGYDVRHFYSRFADWGIGRMDQAPLAPSEALVFDAQSWNAPEIQRRFREAVDAFAPDFVIVTDSWNFKPLLAEAMHGYRYFLRLAAQECLCPLNNVRLLVDDHGATSACPRHQLATPDVCRQCVQDRSHQSGSLHQAERMLSGYGTPDYDRRLRDAFSGAEAVLAVNPLIAAMVSPHAKRVCVVPSGFDPARFPWTGSESQGGERNGHRTTLLFAGLTEEFMKGFRVLQAACQRLWERRRDFELVVTGDAPLRPDPFCRYIGWQSQDRLPQEIRAADILVFPTIAEEALGRSAVEAMGAGRPVIASRIGGLQFTVTDGATGLLYEPGNVDDLARKMEILLDDPKLREKMGLAGRRQFEAHYTWDAIIDRHYLPLLGPPSREYSPDEIARFRVPPDEQVVLGCVLAIQNRPVQMLERTLQTFEYQSVQPIDRVLLDYGSELSRLAEYRDICNRYGWRLVLATPENPTWSLSAAYNLAVSVLNPQVNVVFKGDVDVLLGEDALATAARSGKDRLCIFACLTTTEEDVYPADFAGPNAIQQLCSTTPSLLPMDGEGIHAYPRRWFEQIGGFDLTFGTWGFEDSDLRLRATWSIGVERPTESVLVHQWHPRSASKPVIQQNRDYYESTKPRRQLKRNGGQLGPRRVSLIIPDSGINGRKDDLKQQPSSTRKIRVAIATRSMCQDLYQLSGEFLNLQKPDFNDLYEFSRYRIVGTTALGYFQQLLRLDADWVVNIDEDAFLLNQNALVDLIQFMDDKGFAACGMPDGGVIPIRRHHPVACNAFFNIFDLRRVRPVWNDWQSASKSPHCPEYEQLVPSFARQSERAFDDFEPYYGLFFSLLDANESILHLDANEWRDGISTLLKTPSGEPLLLHAWYAREWKSDTAVQKRYRQLLDDVRSLLGRTSGPK